MRLDRAAWCCALLALAPTAAHAQGFGLNEIGTCAVGRGQAVTGAPCNDPSSIYWNPGATTALPGWTIYAGAAAIAVSGEFTADTTGRVFEGNVPVEFPPHVFINYAPKDGCWAAGFGAYVPYGLTTQWHSDFPGRFSAQRASLQSIYFQPNVAFRIAKGWSIGGGPVFGHSTVELRQSLDLSGVPLPALPGVPAGATFGTFFGIPAGTEFGRARLHGSSTAWGFNVGIHGQLGPDWQVGARYLSQLNFKYDDADATFTQVPTGLQLPASLVPGAACPTPAPCSIPLDALLTPQFSAGGVFTSQSASTRIKHPAQLEAGLGFTGLPHTTLSADFVYLWWSAFDALPVNFTNPALSRTLLEDYDNSWTVRFGAEHAFAIGLRARAGFTYVKTPAPDVSVTALLPDQNRRNYTLGLGIPLGVRYTLDAGYLRVDTSGRRGRIVERTEANASATAAQLNSGFYSLDANIFSLSLRANF